MEDKIREFSPLKSGSKVALDSISKITNSPFIAAQENYKFPGFDSHRLSLPKEIKQLLETIVSESKVEIIYRLTKDSQSEFQPMDRFIRETYVMTPSGMSLKCREDGNYIEPKPATYSFDE